MTVQRTNILNIGLILASAIVAFRFPLETFLAAYAFLGPLHYLTEISWLDQRTYFLSKASRAWILVSLCLLAIPLTWIIRGIDWVGSLAILGAFFGSVLLVRSRRSWIDGALFVAFALFAIGFVFSPTGVGVAGALAILLVTVVHVFLFTGTFMLVGALRGKELFGWTAFIFLIVCGVGLFISGGFVPEWSVSQALRPAYRWFFDMQAILVGGLFAKPKTTPNLFTAPVGLGVMRFVAFAYLYHYLNWFSKTSIIQWHAVSKRRGLLIGIVWLSTSALYLVDYQAGLYAMAFLSLLHVLLEFPLNWKTLGQIGMLITQTRAEALVGNAER